MLTALNNFGDQSTFDRPAIEKRIFGHQLETADATHAIIGASRPIRAVLDQIRIVAPTDSTVLVEGETGTGKELVARAIHQLSRRRKGPLVTLNCAAIPATLLESELFGHERGAFTGAVAQRLGRFEMANGGTLFLDEIGEIALELQAKLLRVLQEQEFERLGSSRTTRVNVRVVAATNRNLPELILSKEFRADLYYRLNVFPVSLPPLRHRLEDIPALARHFMAKCAERMNKVVDEIRPETFDSMLAYDWPGNIRELQNFIERGVIMSEGSVFRPPSLAPARRIESPTSARKTLKDATRDHILQALEQTSWVVGGSEGTAAYLGLARTTLISKMRQLGIETSGQRRYAGSSRREQAFATTA
jgi:formate hydrogenlyase transcriptional activator